jgi:hypothetical protein
MRSALMVTELLEKTPIREKVTISVGTDADWEQQQVFKEKKPR